MTLDDVAWPLARLHEGVEALARTLRRPAASIPRAPVDTQIAAVLHRWMDQAANLTGLEAESTEVSLRGVGDFFASVRSAILALGGEEPTFLIVLRGNARHVWVLGLEQVSVKIPRIKLAQWVGERRYQQALARIGPTIPKLPISERRQQRFARKLVETVAGDDVVGLCWQLRPPPGEPFVKQLRATRFFGGMTAVFVLGFVQALFSGLSWIIFGGESLRGHLDGGRLGAWALLLAAAVPLQVWSSWLLGELAVRASARFKTRLLDGALRISPDVIRHDGVGALLSRVNESAVIEALVVTGGLTSLTAIGDWALAAVLLTQSGSPLLALSVFFFFTGLITFLAWRYYRAYERWTRARLELSSGVVERLVGQRTRIAQERRDRWHDAEDRLLYSYARNAEDADARNALLVSFPKLLPILGALVAAPLVLDARTGPAALVLMLVGVATAATALDSLANVLSTTARGRVAWLSVGPLFTASVPDRPVVSVQAATSAMTQTRAGGDESIVELRDVYFTYPERARPVLERCSLTVKRGDRILLEGSSGGGKSTVASLLAGLRAPDSGLVLVKGLDRHTLVPQQWRSAVAIAPQFHENHIFSNSLAFNLLLGRAWPPSTQDLREAYEVCEELGLGPLIARMPAALLENVGETGWQLSHGEKSRVFVARAILQRSDVMIFDESFGALDPETMERVLACVMKRAPTLIAIAHP